MRIGADFCQVSALQHEVRSQARRIEELESGVEYDKTIVHPEEGVYDTDGGIQVEGTVSVKAADVIDERQY